MKINKIVIFLLLAFMIAGCASQSKLTQQNIEPDSCEVQQVDDDREEDEVIQIEYEDAEIKAILIDYAARESVRLLDTGKGLEFHMNDDGSCYFDGLLINERISLDENGKPIKEYDIEERLEKVLSYKTLSEAYLSLREMGLLSFLDETTEQDAKEQDETEQELEPIGDPLLVENEEDSALVEELGDVTTEKIEGNETEEAS